MKEKKRSGRIPLKLIIVRRESSGKMPEGNFERSDL
jgi:hypothetical protein